MGYNGNVMGNLIAKSFINSGLMGYLMGSVLVYCTVLVNLWLIMVNNWNNNIFWLVVWNLTGL